MYLNPLRISLYLLHRQILHSIFSLALGLAFDPPSSAWPVALATSWDSYIKIFIHPNKFHHVSPHYRGNLGVKFGWVFLSEPRPLKPPCLAEQGWVVGGTVVSRLDSWVVIVFTPLFPFRSGFFPPQRRFSWSKGLKKKTIIYFFCLFVNY